MYFQPYGDDQQLNLNWIINEIINLHKQLDPDYETPSFTQVYPYSNLNRLNLDWILSELKALKELAPEPTPPLDLQAVAEALVALPFDSTKSYQIYDFISKDGEIWCATEAIAAGGEWDETKWFKTKIGTDLAVLERWINTINNSLTAEIQARQDADTALQNAINGLTSANISDDSDAGGATVKASLNALKGSLNGLEAYIRNKKIAIFGDSWSDEDIQWSTTVNDVWVKTFRTLCTPYNATITNYSRSSRGFLVKDNNNQYTGLEAIQNADLTNIDTVIIFLGLNDFLNGIWTGAYTATGTTYLWGALKTIAPLLAGKNVFIITPCAISSRGQNSVICATLELYRIVLANWAKHYGFMLINGTTCPQIGKGSAAYSGSHILNAYHPILAQHIFSKIIGGGEPFSPLTEILKYTPSESVNNVTTFNGVTIEYKINEISVLVDWVVTAENSTSGGAFTMPSLTNFVQRYLTINFANHVYRTSYTGQSNNQNPPKASLYFAQFDQYATGSDVRAQWTATAYSDILGWSV